MAPSSFPTGNVEVALADSPSTSFQQMVLNVVSVRFNPSTDLHISETDKKWEIISPQPPSSGVGPNEAAIDLNSLAIQAQIFNTGPLKTNTTFNQIELVLDPISPGSVVPVCAPVVTGEGCISYPMKVPSGTNLRVKLTPPLTVKNNQLQIVVIDFNPGVISFPSGTSGSFTINPTITVPPVNTFMATGSGTVVKGSTHNEKITAEVPGTGQIVTTVNTQKNGAFTFGLPAAAAGTAYDLFASGSRTTFVPLANQVFTPGAASLGNLMPSARGGAPLSGTIVDKCTGLGIGGVSLEVLTPAVNDPGADCTKTPATGCVVVATATTDAAGSYPQVTTSSTFNAIPVGAGTKYTFRISASAYDSVINPITSATSPLKCPGSGATDDKCNFSLTRGVINGNVTLPAANPGAPLNVMVMAEQSNTNNIANVATTTIPSGSISAPFTIMVPTTKTIATLDLFASAKDLFGGVPEQATGHTIAVLQGVMPPAMATACTTPVSLGSDLGPMDCVGHGSVSGTASTFDRNTTIVLSKGGVQLMQSQVGAGGVYNFCAPADPSPYELRRFESGIPVASAATIVLTAPSLIPTPCSTICATGTPSTCFLCANTPGIVVP